MVDRLPDFLLFGAAKAGTTALYEWLREHPQIFMPRNKELHFFDWHWRLGSHWYAKKFAGHGDARCVGEGTPYMRDPHAAARAAQVIPAARIVAVLRNPIDRAHSHYWHMRGLKAESRTFEEAVEAELSGDADEFHAYISDGYYLAQLQNIESHFPAQNTLIMLFDDLRENPVECYTRVLAFLGLDPRLVPTNVGATYNSAQRIRSTRLRRAQIKYQERLRIPWRLGALVHRLNTTRVAYEPMHRETRERLNAHFAAHNAELGKWLGRSLSHWSR